MTTSAFGLFDIRGKYPEVVNEQLAFLVGLALQNWLLPKSVIIAGDLRESTPRLKQFLIDSFPKETKIYDLGEVPVPEFNFTVAKTKVDLGIMVTASHLSKTDNGFKIVKSGANPLDQAEIEKLKKMVSNQPAPKIVVPPNKVVKLDKTNEYVDSLIKESGLSNVNLNLVLDTVKSSTSTVVPQLFNKLAVNYSLVKGNHEGNPLLEENRRELSHLVKIKMADLGIIWDSDGDRVVFMDKAGKFIPISFVLAILGSEAVKGKRSAVVAVDIRAGLVVRDEVEKAGGKVEVFPAWHQTLQFAMQENPNIVFAGENSGHLIFKDFGCVDDGLFAALKFIDYCQKNNLEERLSQLRNRYFELPEMNFKSPNEKSVQILKNLADFHRDRGDQVSLVDGLTVFGKDFKFNIRESATEPLLRLNMEARNERVAKEMTSRLDALI